MTADMVTYDDIAGRLDHAKVRAAGLRVRHQLDTDQAVALNYEPGDGTRYDLIFTPANLPAQVGAEAVPCGVGLHNGPAEGWFVVSQVNGSTWAYPFNLTPGNRAFASYVYGHTNKDIGWAGACAITALFRVICGVPILDVDAWRVDP